MLGRKLVVIAAAVALAVTQVADASRAQHTAHHATGKLLVHHATKHHHVAKHHTVKKSHHRHAENETAPEDGEAHAEEEAGDVEEETVELCLPGWTEVSVEGVEGIYCAQGQICVADIKDGACPSPQQGLPYGAYCDTVKTGVYGCKPKSEEQAHEGGAAPLCTGEGESPMSVEGVEGVFCVTGQACVADIADGACPGPQEGLPYGAVCGKVKTGVYGCQPAPETTEEEPTDEEDDDDEEEVVEVDVCTGEGESPMSVEGVEGVFCVTGQACVADIKDGACPGPQEGLEYGAYCGTVKTGVYGCKPKSKEQHEHEHAPEEDYDDSEEDSEDSEDSEEETPVGNPALCTGEGESPMSVEGVEGIFCVTGQACVADIADGACPGPQEGLPYGAVCGKVKTGVYGCQPAPETTEEEEPVDDGECGEGESPMSVEGVEGIFCVSGQACVADIKDGACPGPQDGLPNGAECGVVQSGVYGCKPKAAKHHRKSVAKKGHSIKVVKAHAHKKVHHKKH